MRFLAPVLALSFTLASCVAPPVEVPRPAPRPAAPPPLPAPQVSSDWTDWPATAGDWRYVAEQGGTIARFGPVGGATILSIRCDTASRRIVVTRSDGATGTALTVRTSFGVAQWPAQAGSAGIVATRAANDAALDQIAFSRGRFVVETEDAPTLVLPAWAEVARVIEDCRG